jgi:hypothetical protein
MKCMNLTLTVLSLSLLACTESHDSVECDGQADKALSAVADVLRQADRTCASDRDCARITTSTRCVSPCLHRSVVALGALPEVNQAIADIDARFCSSFSTTDGNACEALVPNSSECGLPLEVVCRAGTCEGHLKQPSVP